MAVRLTLRQAEILLQLQERPAKTITELAERMDALRPSVSRSLKALKEDGLIYRDRHGWHLTTEGQEKAAEAQKHARKFADEAREATQRVNAMWERVGAAELAGCSEMMPAVRAAMIEMPRIADITGGIGGASGISSALESLGHSNWMRERENALESFRSVAGMFEEERGALGALKDAMSGPSPVRDSLADTMGGSSLVRDSLADAVRGSSLMRDSMVDAMGGSSFVRDSFADAVRDSSLVRDSLVDAMGGSSFVRDSLVDAVRDSSFVRDSLADAMGGSSFVRDSMELLQGSIQSLLSVQEQNLGLLQSAISPLYPTGIADVFQWQNNVLAGVLDDALAIRKIGFNASAASELSGSGFSWIGEQLSGVTASYDRLFADQIAQLNLERDLPLMPSVAMLQARLVTPTATVGHYTDSLHVLIDAEMKEGLGPLTPQGVPENGDESLDPVLYELDPDFVEMRHGVWFALHQGGPDRLRHAGTSQRELLSQLLRHLVPNCELHSENKQGPQIKARVKAALSVGDSDAEFIATLSVAVTAYYTELNKYTHHNMKHEQALRSLLRAGEGLIGFILAMVDPRRLT